MKNPSFFVFVESIGSRIRYRARNLFGTTKVQISSLNFLQALLTLSPKKTPTIFALDLHTSITRDVQSPLRNSGINVRRWSISDSAELFNEPNLKISYINGSTWRDIDSDKIYKFNRRYQKFLSNQDAFLVSHTFSFLDIFKDLGKPILAINTTRYESPYTYSQKKFDELNALVNSLSNCGLLHIVSNNIGDKDYLRQLSGVDSVYIPNLCDYTTPMSGEDGSWVVLSRNIDLSRKIASQSNNLVSQYDKYPKGFTFEEFARNRGVVVIPYNISTMRLFELTSAGFPVRIPSDRLLAEILHLPGVLSELSWVQVSGKKCPDWLEGTPADPNWIDFIPWWLRRADWNNFEMFPNVSRFDSFDELTYEPDMHFADKIQRRNNFIRTEWSKYVSGVRLACHDAI